MSIEEAEFILMWYISKNEKFRRDIDRIPNSKLFRKYSWNSIELAALDQDTLILENELGLDEILKYHTSVIQIAARYRLPSEWGPYAIHKWAIDAVKGFAVKPFSVPPVETEVLYDSDRPIIEVRMYIRTFSLWRDVVEAIDNVKKKIRGRLERPKERRLMHHAMWLSRRLTTGETWKDITDWYREELKKIKKRTSRKSSYDEEAYDLELWDKLDETRVRKGAQVLARKLGIDLKREL